MRPTSFEPRPLPDRVDAELRVRLRMAHAGEPFSSVDPRGTVRRVADIAAGLGLSTTMCRGGVDLRGIEVDHVWLDVDGRVIDAAFPLYRKDFVSVLRRFVAGDVTAETLQRCAAHADVDERVLGLFPAPIRYLGAPVWSDR